MLLPRALSSCWIAIALGLFALSACTTPSAHRVSTDSTGAPRRPDTLTLKPNQRRIERPTAPLRVEGACPFECCQYGTWQTTAPTPLFRRADDTTAAVFNVPAATRLEAATGHVLLTQIGVAVARDTTRLYRDDASSRSVPPADTLVLLDYVGEGNYQAWYADSVYQTDLSAPIEQLKKPQAQWWAQVTTPDGRSGWLWMERTPAMQGVDACSAPPPRDERAAGSKAAVAVIRDYYAAIDAKNYRRAYRYWDHEGAASNQTFEAFRSGFAATTTVTVETREPGRVEGAAGSRYVEVPVAVRARTTGGQTQRFEGTYTLRRAVVDGASAEQRRWHLYSADLEQVK